MTQNLALAFALSNLAATEAFGQALGRALHFGDHVALVGGMGAGKTTLCRSIAQGFGVQDLAAVASPTYAYAHAYPAGRGTLHHLDFYRLGDAEAAYALGLDDLLQDPNGAALVEWADLVPALLREGALRLTLTRTPGQEARAVRLSGPEARMRALASALPPWVGPLGPAQDAP